MPTLIITTRRLNLPHPQSFALPTATRAAGRKLIDFPGWNFPGTFQLSKAPCIWQVIILASGLGTCADQIGAPSMALTGRWLLPMVLATPALMAWEVLLSIRGTCT